MKKITELTEQEILNLSNENIEAMIKFEKAEQGIKMLNRPEEPKYIPIPPKTCDVYYSHVLGELCFTDVSEIKIVLDVLRNAKTIGQKKYSSNGSYMTKTLKPQYSSDDWDKIMSERVFEEDIYNQIKKDIQSNQVLKNDFEKLVKEYDSQESQTTEIVDSIYDRVREVKSKYDVLERYCLLMRTEYIIIAENNEKMAMKFLDKAYNLTEEQKEYVLENYKTPEDDSVKE